MQCGIIVRLPGTSGADQEVDPDGRDSSHERGDPDGGISSCTGNRG